MGCIHLFLYAGLRWYNEAMNIHPLVVHFPIALLTIYALFELLRFKRITQERSWIYIKAAFLILGTLSAFAAIGTGDFGKELYRSAANSIAVHESAAQATTFVFSLLSLYYLIDLFAEYLSGYPRIQTALLRFARLFTSPIIVILALIGLVGIFITGALGGSIVYGTAHDPFLLFVHNLFGLQ